MTAALAPAALAPAAPSTAPSTAPDAPRHSGRRRDDRPALRVVIRPAPPHDPPFDDELPADYVAPTPWDRQLPFDPEPRPAPATARPRLDDLPDPSSWARRLLVGLIETADGRRPLQQIAPLLGLGVHNGLAGEFERAAQTRSRHWLRHASVRTIRASEPADGVAEVCATVEVGRRVRALALRLEGRNGRWRCTRLQLG